LLKKKQVFIWGNIILDFLCVGMLIGVIASASAHSSCKKERLIKLAGKPKIFDDDNLMLQQINLIHVVMVV
jgi:hypothetical protein